MAQISAKKKLILISSYLGLMGLLFSSVSYFFTSSTMEFLSDAVETEGEVIDYVSGSGSDGSTVYYPIIQFIFNDRYTEFQSNTGANPKSYDVGEKVSVFVLKDDVSSAKVNSWFSLWGLPVIFGVFGVIMLLAAVILLRVALRH